MQLAGPIATGPATKTAFPARWLACIRRCGPSSSLPSTTTAASAPSRPFLANATALCSRGRIAATALPAVGGDRDVDALPSAEHALLTADDPLCARVEQLAGRIAALVAAIASASAPPPQRRPYAPLPAQPQPQTMPPPYGQRLPPRQELLTLLDELGAAAAEARAAAALVRAGGASNDSPRLQRALARLAVAAAAEDAVLTDPAAFAAAFQPLAAPPPSPSPALGQDTGTQKEGESRSGEEAAFRLGAVLRARFLREGYHPDSPWAYGVAMPREDKAAMLVDARRQERLLTSALAQLLAGEWDNGRGAGVGDVGWGADGAAEAAAVAALGLPPPAAGPGSAAVAAAASALSYGRPSSYVSGEFYVSGEELAEDPVLAEVAAAQWQRGGGADGDGGGMLRLTLDACAALLQRHPDSVLRGQVYEEGLQPLCGAALELLQGLRDVRAQQAALYGMYDTTATDNGRDAGGGGGSAGDGGAPPAPPGFGGLAHIDTLAGDGRAAAAFLTSLAEALRPGVEGQLEALRELAAARGLPPPSAGSLERLLRLQAWGGEEPATADADAAEAPAPDGSARGHSFPDPAAPYLTDLAAVMAGVSDWLEAALGLRLVCPAAGDVAREAVAADRGSSGGVAGQDEAVPADVEAMVRDLERSYGSGSYTAGALPPHVADALAALREAAAAEPGRFLAFRLEPHSGAGGGGDGGAAEEVRPPVRWVLLERGGGYGARYVLPPPPKSPSGTGGPPAVAVVVGLQAEWAPAGAGAGAAGGHGAPSSAALLSRGSEQALWEVLHELGHALHFLLASPPSPSPPGARVRPAGPLEPAPLGTGIGEEGEPGPVSYAHAHLPYQLPLELVELPSSLLERGAADEGALGLVLGRCRHAVTGGPPPPVLVASLARAVRGAHYSPISVSVQALSCLLDQLLADSPRKAPGLAPRLWRQLLATFAPGLPAQTTVQQLHALARVARAGGQGYGYVVAACLAEALWEGGRWGAAVAEAGAEGQEERVRWQRLRRAAFELSAAGEPAGELSRLLAALEPGAGAGAREGKGHGAGAGMAGGGRGPPLLLRVAGGGCVPRVDGGRVRRWTGGWGLGAE
ncbi:hypothetical protein HYH03_002585 [Edaphochlamys debaryana]|uniref:Peptidase M3A/M3B catalytic domain-containing protein n=1 Tax=Edaphochlamys debaryana TaxID=47281 RepID=A0A836C3Z9_9CHLO|nr:hypothetical protein HYH03_002585 [Edaphochlamys debaryana]|eukprot:KAG2499646.1 hypothetical protein HYH03_002585 [Edaphochlamys debaryana]